MTVGVGVIGFLDDYLKVVLRRSDGLLAWQKMILQIIVTGVFAVYMVKYSGVALTMLIPFSGGKYLDLGWLAIPVLFFAVVGTVNGTNFTDGLDGLASSVTIMVATFFSVVAIGTNAGIAPITCAVQEPCLDFYFFMCMCLWVLYFCLWYFFIYQIFQIDIYLSGVQLTVQLRSIKLEHSTDARRAISFTAWCYHPIGIC